MDIKKDNLLEDRFELSSFSLKIYNVNAGNQLVSAVTQLFYLKFLTIFVKEKSRVF